MNSLPGRHANHCSVGPIRPGLRPTIPGSTCRHEETSGTNHGEPAYSCPFLSRIRSHMVRTVQSEANPLDWVEQSLSYNGVPLLQMVVMLQRVAVVVAVVVALGAVGASLAAAQPSADPGAAGNDSVLPGERLSGAVGVNDAELSGELEDRAFGLAVARANTDNAKAAAVGDRLDAIDERLTELEERKAALNESRNAGNLSEGQYHARLARLEAQRRHAAEQTNQSAAVLTELPAAAVEQAGIDVNRIEQLREKAGELGGPEIAEIARNIAGNGVGGGPPGAGERSGPIDPGPPDDQPVNASEDRGNNQDDGKPEETPP